MLCTKCVEHHVAGRLLRFGYFFTPTDTMHMRGGWSHMDTSKPVVGYGANDMVTNQLEFEPATFLTQPNGLPGPRLPHVIKTHTQRNYSRTQ
jgi:hypothetical protein